MEFSPVFFRVDDRDYRLHFPYLLDGFETSMLQRDDDREYDSDTRNYMIKGYTHGNSSYDISVKEIGSDLAPGSIEAVFYTGDVMAEVPADMRGMIAVRNEEATQNRTMVYINNARIS
jgi:hypothetical protein